MPHLSDTQYSTSELDYPPILAYATVDEGDTFTLTYTTTPTLKAYAI